MVRDRGARGAASTQDHDRVLPGQLAGQRPARAVPVPVHRAPARGRIAQQAARHGPHRRPPRSTRPRTAGSRGQLGELDDDAGRRGRGTRRDYRADLRPAPHDPPHRAGADAVRLPARADRRPRQPAVRRRRRRARATTPGSRAARSSPEGEERLALQPALRRVGDPAARSEALAELHDASSSPTSSTTRSSRSTRCRRTSRSPTSTATSAARRAGPLPRRARPRHHRHDACAPRSTMPAASRSRSRSR